MSSGGTIVKCLFLVLWTLVFGAIGWLRWPTSSRRRGCGSSSAMSCWSRSP
jgi:hypothetical protein